MNETIKNILERRSIRAFKEDQIKDEDLQIILECGKYAASANNLQPWHFTVIQNKDLLNWIVEQNKVLMLNSNNERYISWANQPNFHLFHHAPTVIVISGDENSMHGKGDCANTTQNMAVAAHSLGLGSCYIASFAQIFNTPKSKEYIKELGIPDGYKPYFSLAVGYKACENPTPNPRKENSVNYIK